MPPAATVLLPLCIGLTVLGALISVVLWQRSSRGRLVQGIGWTLAPAALYLSGLLALVYDGVSAVVGWASRLVFVPQVWIGLSLLALAVVLIGVGGVVARRHPERPAVTSKKAQKLDPNKDPKKDRAVGSSAPTTTPAAATSKPAGRKAGKKEAAPVDDDMAEIEAILRDRGIN